MSELHTADELRAIAKVLECLDQATDDDTNLLIFEGELGVDCDGDKMGILKCLAGAWYYVPTMKGDNDE